MIFSVEEVMPVAFDLDQDKRVLLVNITIGRMPHIVAVKVKDDGIDIREVTIEQDDGYVNVLEYFKRIGLLNIVIDAMFNDDEFTKLYEKLIEN